MGGSLVVVGTGITLKAHLTPEARTEIERADKVFFVLSTMKTAPTG